MGLLDFFSSKPKPKPVQPSGGLLGNVPTGQQQMSYRDYAEQEMMKGRQPLPHADWQKQQQAAAKK
jgi:hypothetical protein